MKNKKTILTVLVMIVAFSLLAYSFFYKNKDAQLTGTTTVESIMNVEIQARNETESDVFATLSTGELRKIASSVPFKYDNFPETRSYQSAKISPNKLFVAIDGHAFEDAIVDIYDVKTNSLHDTIYGKITGWTNEGFLEIETCDLSGETCVDKVSTSAEMPWIVKNVDGTASRPATVTYRDNFHSDVDFISNTMKADNLSRFATLLKETAPDAIKGTGPFTVFVPTNAALGFLTGTMTKKEKIAFVQKYVAAREYKYDDLVDGLSLQTVGLDTVVFARNTGSVLVNGAAVIVEADIQSSNGIIHIINARLDQ